MAYLTPRVSVTQNFPMQAVTAIASASGTITGTAGFGSSLFLQRMFVPGEIAISEIQAAMGMSFNATSNGAGSISRSVVVYSFGNSTSLGSLYSASGSSAWATGTSTAGASASLTQFQGGWAGSVLQGMTFASSMLPPGEYVIGQLFDFAQASSSWSVSLFGLSAQGITSASLGALSSGGLSAGSAFSSSASAAITAFSGAPGAVNVLSSSGLAAGSGVTALNRYGAAFSPVSIAGSGTGITISQAASTGIAGSSSSWSISTMNISVTNTASSLSVQLVFNTANNSIVSNLGVQAGSVISNSISGIALSNASTGASSFMSTGGLVAGSVLTASASINAVTNVGLGVLPTFTYIGTGSTSSLAPNNFFGGLMSTGAVPASIALATAAGLTIWGSTALIQPWFLLAGA